MSPEVNPKTFPLLLKMHPTQLKFSATVSVCPVIIKYHGEDGGTGLMCVDLSMMAGEARPSERSRRAAAAAAGTRVRRLRATLGGS